MILNNAQDIKRGSIQTQYVYHGSILIWPPGPSPEPDWDKYETEYSSYITVVLLDESGNETDDIYYATTLDYALSYLARRYDADPDELFNVYYGDKATLPSSDTLWHRSFINNIYPSGANKNNIKMFRYPRRFMHDTVYDLSDFSGSTGPSYATRLRTIVMPESVPNYTEPVNWVGPIAANSGVEKVVFRGKRPFWLFLRTFENCTNLREVEFYSFRSMSSDTFKGCRNITIKLHNAENSVSGAPWGAENATIMWLG